MKKRLILVADDFGIDSGINDGIALAAEEGALTSAALLVEASATEHAVELARKNPSLEIGLHLSLVAGRPVVDPGLISSLVTNDGTFLPRGTGLLRRIMADPPLIARHSRIELEAQIQKFLDMGFPPSFVNGHDHIHIFPCIADVVLDLMEKYGFYAVRLPYDFFLPGFHPSSVLKVKLLQHFSRRADRQRKRMAIKAADHFFGLYYSGRMVGASFLSMLDRLENGVTEVMFHPGYASEGFQKNFPAKFSHDQELELLLQLRNDPDLADLIEKREIGFVSYQQVFSK